MEETSEQRKTVPKGTPTPKETTQKGTKRTSEKRDSSERDKEDPETETSTSKDHRRDFDTEEDSLKSTSSNSDTRSED